jgi:hypothetical protein
VRIIRTTFLLSILALSVAWAGHAQDSGGLTTRNPLDVILDELVDELAGAGVPFDPAQSNAISLVLEESRAASEQLFGNVMNFSSGPPRGENVERAQAGIAWMNDDFRRRVRQYLSPEQLEVWDAFLLEQTSTEGGASQQVQQIRINNIPFSAESGNSGGGGSQTQMIRRGGTGGWHGNSQLQFRDEALNARNPFASNKPAYQQRNLNGNLSGPLLPDRLTIDAGIGHSQSDSPATVNADTLTGPVRFGFTREQSSKNGSLGGIYQLAANQSVHFDSSLNRSINLNQNVGGANLPERAVDFTNGNESVRVRHVWFHSDRLVQDVSYNTSGGSQRATPHTEGVTINVLGSFSGGGGNRSSSEDRSHQLNTLWIYSGDSYSIRSGGGFYRPRETRTSENNFQGTFTFPSLDAYSLGEPSLYTQTLGDPTLSYSQVEWNSFFQYEHRVTSRLSLFYGLRYEAQSNLDDRNNLDPRLALAYAMGNSTVVRAGAGVYHSGVSSGVEYDLLRLDGERQYEIVISNPSYPDPYASGTATVVPPASRRVRADDLVAPYQVNSSVQVERSLPANLSVSTSLDYRRGYHLLRSRNLNAPLPGQTERPDPAEGNIWRLESTGVSSRTEFQVSMRQRLSRFTLNADYTYEVSSTDTTGTFSAPTNNYDLRSDQARVTGHQFSTRINSQLPLELYLTTNLSWSSGNPYTITTGFDENGDGVTNDRPPGVPRNSERGPYRHNVSFNISKAFPLGDGRTGGANMSLYANMNNAFNRTNLGTPVSNLSSSRFGQYVSASNPREITAGMRFSF